MKESLGTVLDTVRKESGPLGQAENMPLTFARHPELLASWLPLMGFIAYGGALPSRMRELVIARTAWLGQSPLNWVTHIYPARHTKGGKEGGVYFTEDEVAQIIVGPSDEGWSPQDAALLAGVDQFYKLGDMDDETWKNLRENYDEKQIIELMYLVTNYRMVGDIVRTLRTDFGPDFPGLRQR
ncbi:carboxymuconolactone decarboxylase family protein [Streptomyces arenae]|uniref:carboxymuconolactone decarboxylase family protein n=1 Tax=Streptomyces arenae TaxID=29301 RepID=UPI00265AF3C3|nr:carboxymuconolactone decarboxylase family protein [Streptomyces arenae]MCG7210096.1 carboxymuconolactone decarboxylase family protein [Streptomyces arenae]